MPSKDFIDVRVLVNGQPAREYSDANGSGDEFRTKIRYIEVEAGQNFEVEVTLLSGFTLMRAPHIYAELKIDDSTAAHYGYVDCRYLQHMRGALLNRTMLTQFVGTRIWDDGVGKWMSPRFEFGALGTNDSTERPSISIEDVDKIGSIRVKVYRARAQKLDTPYLWTGEEVTAWDELPERVLKGRSIKTNTKYTDHVDCDAPQLEHYEYVPIKGNPGKPYEFIILYRTRNTLQNMGCIPQSPSPPPDDRVMLERQEEMLKDMKRKQRQMNLENMRLRDQLARSESGSRAGSVIDLDDDASTLVASRQASIKREVPDGFGAKVKMEPRAGSLRPEVPKFGNPRKRTREEFQDGDDDELAEVAPPPKKPAMVIDLTDD